MLAKQRGPVWPVLAAAALTLYSAFCMLGPHFSASAHSQQHRRRSAAGVGQRQELTPLPRAGHVLYVLQSDAAAPPLVHRTFRQMQAQLGVDRVFWVVNTTAAPWEGGAATRLVEARSSLEDSSHAAVLLFNASDTGAVGSRYQLPPPQDSSLAHHQQAALYISLHRHFEQARAWDFLWHFEAGAVCNGDYNECLAGTESMREGFLCVDVANGLWGGNGTKDGGLVQMGPGIWDKPDRQHRFSCGMQIKRFSRRALWLLAHKYPDWYGFDEVRRRRRYPPPPPAPPTHITTLRPFT